MKFNTLRQYFEYHAWSGFLIDRRATRLHGTPQVFGQQIPFELGIQKQFPHLKYQARFINQNLNLKRKRYTKLFWLPDLIHFLYFKSPPVGPLIYQGEKRYEYEEWLKKAEADRAEHIGEFAYRRLDELTDFMPSPSREEHYKIENLSWFAPRHPRIYWHWRAQRWRLQLYYNGRRASKSYAFDDYVDAAADLIQILAKIRNVPLDRLNDDPDLAALEQRLLPLLPRSQSARATALGIRRPETRIEALWRAQDEQLLHRFLDNDELPYISEFDAQEDHAVQAMASSIASDGVEEVDL
jgi:hypothetical protein